MENNKQQTAIQEMIDELDYDLKASGVFVNWEFYLQMEKEQIKAAYNKGYQDGEIDSLDAKDGDVQYFEDAEQYYKETYGKE
jgi:hypothetical protein